MSLNEYIWTFWNFCAIIRNEFHCNFNIHSYGVIQMKPMSKLKHQVKSNKYYLFWGAATIAVMAGQIYVGAGYREMSNQVKDLTEIITIKMEWDELNSRGGGFIY